MKFSVLLPTRNRLEYLRYAVETVRRQDYAEWEIIVSDNDSEDDIAGYVASLADMRIVYSRTEQFVPVTENWNSALSLSTGDFVVMLGDDDGLLPGYFTKVVAALQQFPNPDLVYGSALFFAYPGVMPDAPEGFLRADRNGIFTRREPFWLEQAQAHAIARGYLDFRMPVASNMQFSCISRRLIDKLSNDGPFFRSPYPDFYATPLMFEKAERILILPDPLVVIGITPKSYGFFHFNNRAGDGVEFLNNRGGLATDLIDSVRLPGTSYNDSWLLAAEALAEKLGRVPHLLPAYGRYRMLQIIHCHKRHYLDGALGADVIHNLRNRLRPLERWAVSPALTVGFVTLRQLPIGLRSRLVATLRKLIGQHSISDESRTKKGFGNLLEVFESARAGEIRLDRSHA